MSIFARTRQSTWSTDAPGSSTFSGAQFCGGEAGRHWAFCFFLDETHNIARSGTRPEVAALRPISAAVQLAAHKSAALRPNPLHAERSAEATSRIPKPLGPPPRSNLARSLVQASRRPSLSAKIAPRERFQLSSRNFGRSISRRTDQHLLREARFEPPAIEQESPAPGLSASSWDRVWTRA